MKMTKEELAKEVHDTEESLRLLWKKILTGGVDIPVEDAMFCAGSISSASTILYTVKGYLGGDVGKNIKTAIETEENGDISKYKHG